MSSAAGVVTVRGRLTLARIRVLWVLTWYFSPHLLLSRVCSIDGIVYSFLGNPVIPLPLKPIDVYDIVQKCDRGSRQLHNLGNPVNIPQVFGAFLCQGHWLAHQEPGS